MGRDATARDASSAPVSLFDVNDPPTRSGCPRPRSAATARRWSWSHRVSCIWPETGQLVLPVDPYWCSGTIPFEGDDSTEASCEQGGAVVLQVQGDTLAVQGRVAHPSSNGDPYQAQIQRSMVVGGRLVTVSSTGVLVSDLASLEPIHWIPLS